jgi:hypothetical protein
MDRLCVLADAVNAAPGNGDCRGKDDAGLEQ